MSETDKTEKIETEKKRKTSSKVNTPVQTEGGEQKTATAQQAATSEVSSKVTVPVQADAAAPRSAVGEAAGAMPSPLSKQPPAAAKAAAPKSSAAAKAAVQKPPAAAKAAAPKQIRIRQIKSGICAPVDQKLTLSGLGLRRIRHEVVRPDTPTVRGQVRKVRHLVEIVEGGVAR
jgi:large subunit ribosomal protein L30